ncbi:SRPBCC family protein [Pedobacter sp. PWIIR3]
MESKNKTVITVNASVNKPVEKVWESWTLPQHITKWTQASDDWHAPFAENDLRIGGKFKTTMAAKDGSFSFDFEGIYDEVIVNELIKYTIGDGRQVEIKFNALDGRTEITESFDAEDTHSIEMQQGGWQAILNNFKKYTEENL